MLMAVALFFLHTPQPALACEPTPPPPPGFIAPTPIPVETQVAGESRDAQIVLDGTVMSWVASSGGNSVLTVQVERYLKGHGPKTVKITGYFWDCAPNFAFDEGSRSIFFVNGDPASKEPLQVRSWNDAQEAVVTSIRAVTGQEPAAPDGTFDVLWLGLPVILILGIIVLIRYRRTRSN